MACNYRYLGSLRRARNLLGYVQEALEELPKDLVRNLTIQQIKIIEVYMDKLEEEYRNE